MKKLLFTTLLLAGFQLLLAQSNMKITTSTNFIVSGNANVVMDTGNFVNDGHYLDSTGTFVGKGGINFNGTGTTRFRKLRINNTQQTTFNSTVSVYDTADLESGSLDANNNLYLRSDVNQSAHMIVSGILTDHVKGLATYATPATGSCPSYVSSLRLNISGPHMTYQWQSAPDSATWTDIPTATGATYTATVTATIFCRCHLHTDNSSYDQVTPGRKLVLPAAPSAGIITGLSTVNEAANISLTNSVPGGTWTADNSNATVSSIGLVTGVTAGTVTISYTVSNACGSNSATKIITVNTATASPITGTLSVCTGATTTLGNATPGGTWTSTNVAVATVNATTGIVFGLSPGTTTIAYTIGSAAESVVVTVNAAPLAGSITGASSVCTGASALLSASGTGGVWSSSNLLRATVDAGGIVTGLSTGSLVINYTVTNSCGTALATSAFMVNPVPSAISGQLTVCPGSLTTLTNSPAGGVWSSPDATVSVNPANGKVTGVSPGIALIEYQLPTGCGVTAIVTVNPHPGPISGTLAVCPGSTTNLTNTVSGGTWVSNNISRAIIDSNTGVATGISPGNAVITYYAGAGCFTHSVITVNAAPGAITGSLAICTGTSSDLNSSTPGGVWSSSNPAVATVNATNGIVTSVAGTGTAMITYTVAGICPRSAMVTVSTASPNTGDAVICLGQPVAVAVLSNATPGGVWSSSNTGRAVISGSTGVMNGVSTGTVTIYYTLNPGCFSATIVTVNPAVAVILGSTNVCPGASTTLNCSTPGGTWITSDPSIANAAGSTGTISGVAQGAATVTYQVSSGCYRSTAITVPASPTPIAGTTTICQGSSTTFTSAPAGGTWSVSNITIATIASGSGQITGVTTGNATVSYRISSGCSAVRDITINPAVAAITGTANICPTATTNLNNTDAGGNWSSSNTARATVDVLTGAVTGISAGTVVITYALTPACYRTTIQTILTAPSPIAGPSAVCEDGNIVLSAGPAGGIWSSSNIAAASVGTSGTVRGIAAGNSTIVYQLANGCSASRAITVNGLPSPVAGTAAVCVGASTSLSVSPSGGIWSSSNFVKATVDPSLGTVTGLSPGTSNISYTLPNGCFSKVVTTVNATPVSITGAATVLQGAYTPLSCATPGGVWISGNLAVATVNSGSGVVYGVAAGNVSISYTLLSGCAANHEVDVVSARPEEAISGADVPVSIYPNPASGSITIESPGAGTFTVHTIDGKLVAQFPIISSKTEISLPSELAAGSYLCYFEGFDGSRQLVKLIYQP